MGRIVSLLLLLLVGVAEAGNRRFITPAAPSGDCVSTTCLAVMNFDGSGCAHDPPTGPGLRTCTLAGGANADCNTAPCPLEAVFSFQSTNGQSVTMDGLTPITTGSITLDFIWHPPADPPAQDNLIEFYDGTQRTCRIQWRTGGQLRALANGGQASLQWDSTVGNSYWIRAIYNIGLDDCRLIVHAWDGANIGANLHDATADGELPPTQVVGWRSVNGASQTINLETVTLCLGDLGPNTATRCGD